MLKIDVIRFEVQDVITTSVARLDSGKECECSHYCYYNAEGKIVHGPCACERFDYEFHPKARRE